MQSKVFRTEVLSVLCDHFHIRGSAWIFPYKYNNAIVANECYEDFVLAPSTTGVWEACHDQLGFITQLYIFSSAIEGLSFFTVFSNKLINVDRVACVALGISPSVQQIVYLKERFPKAKVNIIYGSDLLGKIIDCKIALWYKGQDADFKVDGRHVSIRTPLGTSNIPEFTLSLSRFEKTTGLRSGIRTYKAPIGFTSYYQFITTFNFKHHE